MSVTGRSVVAGVAITLVAGAIATGVYLIGSPAEQRLYRLDERRVEDLEYLRGQIQTFASLRKRLPATLQEVPAIPDSYLRDPATGQPYGYRVTGADSFELCADFNRPSEPERVYFAQNIGKHGAGHTCFPQVEASLRQPSK